MNSIKNKLYFHVVGETPAEIAGRLNEDGERGDSTRTDILFNLLNILF
jgi:hypothetical protein